MMKRTALTLILAGICLAGFGQQDYLIDQYMFNSMYINPAVSGSKSANATALFRKQWAGFDGSPSSGLLSVDGPWASKNFGLGLILAYDMIGVTNQTDIYANYAYHLKLGKGHLGMGLQGGASLYSIRLTEHRNWDEGDVLLQENKTLTLPNFGTGFYYYIKDKFHVGVSIPHLMNYKPNTFLSVGNNLYQEVRHYYLNGGYVYTVNENVLLYPSVLIKYVHQAPIQADLNLSVLLKELVWLGGSYRTGDSFVAIIGIQLKSQLRAIYSYDQPLTIMRYYASGSHEVGISYSLRDDSKKNVSFF